MASVSSATPTSSLGQDDYLQLLVAQLQNQNPLEPVGDTEFISQVTQFNTLNSLQQLNASFDQLLKLQQLTDGANLIGKTVEYNAPGGGKATGKVSEVSSNNGLVQLRIDSNNVSLDNISKILA